MKEYRVTVNVKLNEVAKEAVPGPGGQAVMAEKVVKVQVTETAGAGPSPKAALEAAMANGIGAYLEDMAGAGDSALILGPESEN